VSAGRRGIPFVVAAPSGTGKTTVCRRVVERDPRVEFSVSHTTRPRRDGEQDGVHYHFVDRATFDRLAAEGAFLEWAEYNDNRYGTSWRSLEEPLARGHAVLLEIEVQGAAQVRHSRSACGAGAPTPRSRCRVAWRWPSGRWRRSRASTTRS
jgi:guanylate kinase